MLLGKKIVRVTAALLVAFAAGHAAETLKAPNGEKSISIETVSASEITRKALSATESAVPPAATLAADGSPALQDLVGITSVAATLPKPEMDACSPELNLSAAPGAIFTSRCPPPAMQASGSLSGISGPFVAAPGPMAVSAFRWPAMGKQDALVRRLLEEACLLLGRVDVLDGHRLHRFALAGKPRSN